MSKNKVNVKRRSILDPHAPPALRKLESILVSAYKHLGVYMDSEVTLRLYANAGSSSNRKVVQKAIHERMMCDNSFADHLRMRVALARSWEILPKGLFKPCRL